MKKAELWVLVIIMSTLVSSYTLQEACRVTTDCTDQEGRTLCYQNKCQRDLVCKQDLDCDVYVSGDVEFSSGKARPTCVWNNRSAAPSSGGVCRVRNSQTKVPQSRQADVCAVPRCPDGWMLRGGTCYAFIKERTSWYEAKELCITIGGHLVEISTPEKNSIVATIVAQKSAVEVWIGLHDHVQENHFVWATSRQVANFTSWYTRQPDNDIGNEACVELWPDGFWNDAHCRDLTSAICETPVRYEQGG